jgi:hypothetical protein
MNKDWGDFITEVSTLIENKENYQKRLGQLSATIVELNGSEALKDFAGEVTENTGYKVSPITLRNYAWVYLKTVNLNLPDDMPFRIYQALAGVEKQDPYVKMIEEGYSAGEVIRKIREDKGYTKKEVICPKCGATINAQDKKV